MMEWVLRVFQVHERTEELDFLLLVVRKLLHYNSRFVKVCVHTHTHTPKSTAWLNVYPEDDFLSFFLLFSFSLSFSPTVDSDVGYN